MYPLQMDYSGIAESGDLISFFGGGNGLFSLDSDGKVRYNGSSDNFRTYVQCMAEWHKRGYIGPAAPERSGMWMGTLSQLGAAMDSADSGMCVYGAAQPVNDVYGGEAQQGRNPDTFRSNPMTGAGSIVTDKAKNKDLAVLFTAWDYFYSYEGGLLRSYGFSNEQTDLLNNDFYREWGLDETGAYTVISNGNGTESYRLNRDRDKDPALAGSLAATRINGMTSNANVDRDNTPLVQHAVDLWARYENTGSITPEITGQLDADASAQNETILTNLTAYQATRFRSSSPERRT